MAGDRDRLKHELARVLDWDATVTEGVVNVLAKASSQAEVDSIVKDFMDNHGEARRLVAAFRGAGVGATPPPPMPGMVPYKKGEGLLHTEATAAPRQSVGPAPQAVELPPGAAAAGKAKERLAVASPSKPQIDLGINVRTTVAKPRKAKGAAVGGPSIPGAVLDRKVVNCLSCGKARRLDLATVSAKLALPSLLAGCCCKSFCFCSPHILPRLPLPEDLRLPCHVQ